jgi:hypothetical protein
MLQIQISTVPALFSGVAAVNHFVLETVNRKATSKSWGLEML